MKEYDRQEYEALRFAGLSEMPEILENGKKGGKVWVKAIAVVASYSGTRELAIVRNRAAGAPAVIKTFGSGGIKEIMEIHPYEYAEDSIYPMVKNREEAVKFVANTYGVSLKEASALSDEKLKAMLDNYAIQMQAEKTRDAERLAKGAEKARNADAEAIKEATAAYKPEKPKKATTTKQ